MSKISSYAEQKQKLESQIAALKKKLEQSESKRLKTISGLAKKHGLLGLSDKQLEKGFVEMAKFFLQEANSVEKKPSSTSTSLVTNSVN